VNPEIEDRLRAHVAAILARAAVPAQVRSDLEEELFGHLVERFHAYLADGIDEPEAGQRAIADFGTPGWLGSELGRTYHSRLWASTIGMLLPAIALATSRPGVVGWLRFVLGLAIVFTAIGLAAALPTLTPVRALGSGASFAIGLTGLILAFKALGRAQRWALDYAIAVTAILLIEGIWQVVAPDKPGSIIIPVGAILAAGVLLSVLHNWLELKAFVAPSARVNRALGVALAISLLAPAIVPRALAAMPDPTQANATDLELRISLACDRGNVAVPDGPTLVDRQRAKVVVDMTWSHTDLLPSGLAGMVSGSDDGDTSGIRLVDPASVIAWAWTAETTIVDLATGAKVGRWGSTSPSVGLLPADTEGSLTIGIDREAIQLGHTIRATWLLYAAPDGSVPWPRIEAMYAHLDRFLIAGTVGCGETVLGRHVPVTDSSPPPITDPFPF
jgi:hypothetical protein